MKRLILIGLILQGCATPTYHVSDKEDTWLVQGVNIFGISISNAYFCQANKQDATYSKPRCYKAEDAYWPDVVAREKAFNERAQKSQEQKEATKSP